MITLNHTQIALVSGGMFQQQGIKDLYNFSKEIVISTVSNALGPMGYIGAATTFKGIENLVNIMPELKEIKLSDFKDVLSPKK